MGVWMPLEIVTMPELGSPPHSPPRPSIAIDQLPLSLQASARLCWTCVRLGKGNGSGR